MAADPLIIWLASFPKSGNTWLRLLLANLLSGSEQPVNINQNRLPEIFPVHHVEAEELMLIDTSLLTREEADLLRPIMIEAVSARRTGLLFAKVHDAYRLNPDGEPLLGRSAARAALYIVRDPRDVAISLAFFNAWSVDWAIERLNSFEHTLSRSWNRLQPELPQLLLDWSGHVTSWTEQRDVPVHVLRYEDLRADPVGTFGAAVTFLGLDATPAAVERAVRCADFAELQRQEQQAGFRERPGKSVAPFFRAGRAGAWAEILNPAQQEAILAAHRPVMARFGYV
jgi:aryl sulfotransferase